MFELHILPKLNWYKNKIGSAYFVGQFSDLFLN